MANINNEELLSEEVDRLTEENKDLQYNISNLKNKSRKIKFLDVLKVSSGLAIFFFIVLFLSMIVIYPIYMGITVDDSNSKICYIEYKYVRGCEDCTLERYYKLYRSQNWSGDLLLGVENDINKILELADKLNCKNVQRSN